MAKKITEYNPGFLKKMLRDMLLIRRFEETAGKMYGLRKIGGFCHLYIGQEATVVGAMAALDLKKDYVLTGYRDHGHALMAGSHPNSLMAELYGKVTGCSKGKGGSMHFFNAENHMLGGNGIVGGHIPVATGVAFKISYNKEDGVVLCYFGDGAIHQGAFHESLNMARIWNLPIIYICENNQYGMGTEFRRVSSQPNLASMSSAYDMPGRQINGMDVLEVYEHLSEFVQLARTEKMPSLLEIQTYRYRGHSMSDPAKYRSKEELDEYKQRDPILMLKSQLLEHNLLMEEDFAAMDKECKDISNESVKFAEKSEEPPLSAMYEDILA